ncbi:MAG: site-2 protease family protein [bacterium]|nr:site-2 protease family protein [bacterium]
MDRLLDVSNAVPILIALILSAAPHEMMHALVAHRLGDDLAHSQGRISLNPLRHIDPFLTIGLPMISLLLGGGMIMAAKPVPVNTMRLRGGENGMALVGLAGPLTNLVIAAALAIPLNIMSGGGALYQFIQIFFLINVSLCVFNLLPIPPLDGSRALYAIAPRPVQRLMEAIEAQGLIFLFILIFVFGSAIYPIIDAGRQFLINILIR